MRSQASIPYDGLITQSSSNGIDSEKDQDKTPKPAIFTIPIHATTHAPSNEYLEGEDMLSSAVQMTGRPAATPDAEARFGEYLIDREPRPILHPTLPHREDTIPGQSVFSLLRSTSTLKAKVTASQRRLSLRLTQRKQQPSARPSLRLEETPFPGLISEEPNALSYQQIQKEALVLEVANDAHPTPTPSAPDTTTGGRFPRWRGWLEKKALERQSEQADSARHPRRKKSWGAGVNDEDAISDGEQENEESSQPVGPLHTYYMGSRFISHLPSLPLCSAYLDLPPPVQTNRTGQRLLRRRIPEALKRKVLLIGTAEGLYVAELPRKSGSDAHNSIRYRQVWKGAGVYQMAILTTILLALCSNVKEEQRKNLGSSNVHASTSNHNLSATPLSAKEMETSSLPSSHFGAGAGGGPTKVVPPSGSGKIHMWSLEALRRMASYALDTLDASTIDLLQSQIKVSETNGGKSLSARLRRAWASLGDPSSERRSRRRSRQAASLGEATNAPDQYPSVNKYRNELSTTSDPLYSMTHVSTASSTSDQPGEFGRMQNSPEENVEDNGYDEMFRLAQDSITIKLPSGSSMSLSGAPTNLGQSESLTSLFSDEALSAASASNIGHSSHINSQSASKGVNFFCVFEAKAEVGAYGTWYMAIATSRSIYLYEAARPSTGDESRSWVFVKEFNTPLPARAITFTYSQTSSRVQRSHTQSKKERSSGHTNSQAMHTTQQQQVTSSAYSSVFRSHYDLSLFVSFGKKAILIKVNDGSVKEFDIETSASMAAASVSSPTSERAANKSAASPTTTSKRRSLSVDLMTSDSRREQWIGLEKVESEIAIRRRNPEDSMPSSSQDDSAGGALVSRMTHDDDDDAEEEEEANIMATLQGYHGLGFTLQDVPLPKAMPSMLVREPATSSYTSISPKEDTPHILIAKLAIFSKGNISFIYPLPLPSDMSQQRPLNSIKWKEPPMAVTAWSRIIGLERNLSSGPISITSLGAQHVRQAAASSATSEAANSVQLHVKVTALALLANAIETKYTDVKVQVTLPFSFDRDSELELQSIDEEASPNVASSAKKEEEVDEGEDPANIGIRIETEYLSGMLDVAERGNTTIKPREATGDAGIWAFDWRGTDDYRLFYTGVRV